MVEMRDAQDQSTTRFHLSFKGELNFLEGEEMMMVLYNSRRKVAVVVSFLLHIRLWRCMVDEQCAKQNVLPNDYNTPSQGEDGDNNDNCGSNAMEERGWMIMMMAVVVVVVHVLCEEEEGSHRGEELLQFWPWLQPFPAPCTYIIDGEVNFFAN
uniref:Uncharacterized protein n=1 Tax=Oryza glumipatula TaxID=40148 RepID=A0A0E0BNW2_9ORYZ